MSFAMHHDLESMPLQLRFARMHAAWAIDLGARRRRQLYGTTQATCLPSGLTCQRFQRACLRAKGVFACATSPITREEIRLG